MRKFKELPGAAPFSFLNRFFPRLPGPLFLLPVPCFCGNCRTVLRNLRFMPLTRALEEHEVSPEVRRIFSDVRGSFGLPFVPTLFKFAASTPDYLTVLWADLGPVVR